MTQQTKTYLLGAVGVAIIAGLIWYGQQNRNGSTSDEPIKIGFIGPLTGDGAFWGLVEKNAIELAVNEINDAGGVNGRRIEVTYENGKCIGKDAVSAAQKLINSDGTKILLVTCSQEVVPIAPIAEQEKVIVFASVAMSSVISDVGDYVFRNSYTNAHIAQVAAETILEQHTSVGVISELSEFAADLRDQFRKEFQAGGGTVYEENFADGSKDVRTQVTNLIAKQPDAIFINPNAPATGVVILQQLQELGFRGQVYATVIGSSAEIQQMDSAQAMIFIADPPLVSSPRKEEFLRKYEEIYGERPGSEYAAGARYDAVYIFKQAIEQVGDDPTAIKEYLYSMSPYEGLLGTYGFDENGDPTGIKPVVNQIINGQAVLYGPD